MHIRTCVAATTIYRPPRLLYYFIREHRPIDTAVYYVYYIIIIYVSRVPPSSGYITLVVID